MQDFEKKRTLTYKQDMTRQEMSRIVSAVGVPLAVFALGAVCIYNLGAMGNILVGPLSAAMWLMGLFVCIVLPSHRKQAINMTLGFCAGYYAGLIGLKILLMALSGLSGEMLAASLNTTLSSSVGNTMVGLVGNVLSILSIIVPITYMVTMAKMLYNFRRQSTLSKEYIKASGIRRNGKTTGRQHM